MKSELDSIFQVQKRKYVLYSDKFVCNKYGLAQFLADNFGQLKLNRTTYVLDVGCGTGPLEIFLADMYQFYVTGIELNPIAYNCCQKNIHKYTLGDYCHVIKANFSEWAKIEPGDFYDLIISNPPVDDHVSISKILHYAQDDYKNLDSASFSYLTNSWHDSEGWDLTDWIFMYAGKHLNAGGRVVIVFCMIDCADPEYVLRKASRFGFSVDQIIKGKITADSIGVEINGEDKIDTYIVSFKDDRK